MPAIDQNPRFLIICHIGGRFKATHIGAEMCLNMPDTNLQISEHGYTLAHFFLHGTFFVNRLIS